MYRVLAASGLAVLSAAIAQASSILSVPDTTAQTPSVIALGSAEAPTLEGVPMSAESAGAEGGNPPVYRVGDSILALGVDAIPSAPVAVASIGQPADAEKEEPRVPQMPLVIRGGVTGSAFSAPPAEEIQLPEEAADGEPEETAEPAKPQS